MATRKTYLSLLEKLGVEVSGKMSMERLKIKAGRYLDKKGAPDRLSDDEKELVKELTDTAAAPEGATPAETATETAEAPSEGKSSKKAKTGKADAKKADKKANKPAKAPKKAKTERKVGGLTIFKQVLEKKTKISWNDLVAEVVKAGATESSAHAYISWAKREKNPFGFRLEVVKAKDGTKMLHKIAS